MRTFACVVFAVCLGFSGMAAAMGGGAGGGGGGGEPVVEAVVEAARVVGVEQRVVEARGSAAREFPGTRLRHL